MSRQGHPREKTFSPAERPGESAIGAIIVVAEGTPASLEYIDTWAQWLFFSRFKASFQDMSHVGRAMGSFSASLWGDSGTAQGPVQGWIGMWSWDLKQSGQTVIIASTMSVFVECPMEAPAVRAREVVGRKLRVRVGAERRESKLPYVGVMCMT